MAIRYFPKLYEDELFYSALCRWNTHEGNLSYNSIRKELFFGEAQRPDIDYVNSLSEELKTAVLKENVPEDIILKHTMFPYYTRFWEKAKKEDLWNSLIAFQGRDRTGFSRLRNTQRYLRVCPLCMEEQKNSYGESYYMRQHQIYGVDVCPKHGCLLIETNTKNERKTNSTLFPADGIVIDKPVQMGTKGQQDFANYVTSLLFQSFSFETQNNNKDLFLYYFNQKGYLKGYENHIDGKKYASDIIEFYMTKGIRPLYQIGEDAFNLIHSNNPLCFCYLAYFLNIPIEELICPSHYEVFNPVPEDQMIDYVKNGLSYREIQSCTNLPYRAIKKVCERNQEQSQYMKKNEEKREQKRKEERAFWLHVQEKHPAYNQAALFRVPEYKSHITWLRRNDFEWMRENYKNGAAPPSERKKKNWKAEDERLLPLIQREIHQIENSVLPQILSIGEMMRRIGYPEYMIQYFPKCRAEIESHTETYPEFWAREIIYIVKELQNDNEPIILKRITERNGLTRSRIAKAVSYIKDEEIQEMIQDLL
jgi:hypothetical protein